jgi:predicted metal-dependent hydrolase
MASSAKGKSEVIIQAPQFDRPEVEIRASAKRKKTGTAHWAGSRIVVQIPVSLKGKARTQFVDDLVNRLITQRPQIAAGDVALEERARVLAELYNDGIMAASVRWVSNQKSRWASCSPDTKEIRVSSRLTQCPEWVIDCVLVHELAHLQEADHGPEFYEIANRHPRQDECGLYLEGYALGLGIAIQEGDVLN